MRRIGVLGFALWIICGVTALGAIDAAPAHANQDTTTGTSTSKTDEADLVQRNGGKGVADVKYRCTETLTAKGEISVECEFKNRSKRRNKHFIVCMMLDLKKAKQKPVPAIKPGDKHDYVLKPDANNPKVLKCVEVKGSHGSSTSYHLGCKLINLKPGETLKVKWNGKAPFVAPPNTKVTANDFWINYADTINLGHENDEKPELTLDENSCGPIIGQGQFLTPEVDGVTANWVAREVAFKDPVLGFQGTTLSAATDSIYELLSFWPCAPPDLPAANPPEGSCPPPSSRPPPPTKLDLNLYWFDSVSAPRRERYPTVLRVTETGHTRGVRVVTNPASGRTFTIRGGQRRFGSIMACATAVKHVCVAPDLPEGTRTRFEVDALSAKGKRTLFEQFGSFVQDSQPPYVDRVAATSAAGEGDLLRVHATDAITSPVAATVWYSANEGLSWRAAGLPPASDVLDSRHSRWFAGRVAVPPEAGTEYYVVVADELDNEDWYGPSFVSPVSPNRYW
jgi:hypothetical protein